MFNKIRNMTIEQKLETLGVQSENITSNTYVYMDEEFQLQVIEKTDRQSYVVDEIEGEYVIATEFQPLHGYVGKEKSGDELVVEARSAYQSYLASKIED